MSENTQNPQYNEELYFYAELDFIEPEERDLMEQAAGVQPAVRNNFLPATNEEVQAHQGRIRAALAREQAEGKYYIREFYTREFDEPIDDTYGSPAVSNEPNIYHTFPYINEANGAAIGVASDQMFEFAVNSKAERIYIIDISDNVYLTDRAVLEIGRRHKELLGAYPTRQEFLSYFSEDFQETTLALIGDQFRQDEVEVIRTELGERGHKDSNSDSPDPDAPIQMERYYKYKMQQTDYNSWLSSDENMHRIFDMYEQGNIVVAAGNLYGPHTMPKIGEDIASRNMTLSYMYFSNAPHFGQDQAGDYPRIDENLARLPLTEDSVLIYAMPDRKERMPRPRIIKEDPFLNGGSLGWSYEVFTYGDHLREREGAYTYFNPDSGNVEAAYCMADREMVVYRHHATAAEMGLQRPEKGLILGGFPAVK